MLLFLTVALADAVCSVTDLVNMFLGTFNRKHGIGNRSTTPVSFTSSSAWNQFNGTMPFGGNIFSQRGTKRKASVDFESVEILTTKKHSFNILDASPLAMPNLDSEFMLGTNNSSKAPYRTPNATFNGNLARSGWDALNGYREDRTTAPIRSPVRALRQNGNNGRFSSSTQKVDSTLASPDSSVPVNRFSSALPARDRAVLDYVRSSRSAAGESLYKDNWVTNFGSAQTFAKACVAADSSDYKNVRSISKINQQHARDMRINNNHQYSDVPEHALAPTTAFYPSGGFARRGESDSRNVEAGDADITILNEKRHESCSVFHTLASPFASMVKRFKDSFSRKQLDAAPRTPIVTPPSSSSSKSLADTTGITAQTDSINQLLQQLQVEEPEFEVIDVRKRAPTERWDVFELDGDVLNDAVNKMSAAGRLEDEFVRKFHIPITRKDLRTLYRSAWLNDEVCNFYFELIKERNEKSSSNAAAIPNGGSGTQNGTVASRLPKVHIFNTHFFKMYIDRGYDHVKKWTKKFDLFALDMVLMPVNLSDTHWTIIKVDFRERSILYYDSLYAGGMEFVEHAKAYIESEYRDKKKGSFDFTGWKFGTAAGVPRQKNGFDCGVFMCRVADCLAADRPLSFTQDDMQFFRNRMACEILQQKLYK